MKPTWGASPNVQWAMKWSADHVGATTLKRVISWRNQKIFRDAKTVGKQRKEESNALIN
jgi:hypothetical protein